MFSLVCSTRGARFLPRCGPSFQPLIFSRCISLTPPVLIKKKKGPAPISKKRQQQKEKKQEQKRLAELRQVYESSSLPVLEAVKVLRAVEITRPNATYELNIQLHFGRGAMVPRGRIVLPKAFRSGKEKSEAVVVFAEPRMAELSKAAGAEHAGGMELVDSIVSGDIRPTLVLATPGLVKLITKPLGRVLGPLGLMPSERRGTVMDDPATHVSNIRESQQWASDTTGVIRTAIGKTSFTNDEVATNVKHFVDTVKATVTPTTTDKSGGSGAKPSVRFLRVMLSSQQGPGITLSDIL